MKGDFRIFGKSRHLLQKYSKKLGNWFQKNKLFFVGFVLGSIAVWLFIVGRKNFLAINLMLVAILVIILIAVYLRKPSLLKF